MYKRQVENTDLFLLYGFYADGYFDRRPMKVQASTVTSTRVAVSANTANFAYRGTCLLYTSSEGECRGVG